MESLSELEFACPRCDRSPLSVEAAGLACKGCKVEFPLLDGLPCLFAEPGGTLGEWRGRLHFLLQTLGQESARYAAAVPGTSALTRQRLELMAEATADHAKRLARLLAPLDVDALTASQATYLALRTKLPSDQALTTYYSNVHRDWCWGREENEASAAIVLDALPGPAGRTLVLGAGAGRLAYDIHERGDGAATVALDFNPLLMLLARRIAAGETVELHEFPIAPIGLAQQAVLNSLAAEQAARPGLHFCLADAHRPPFPAQSFDTIVTPWLVDILPEPFDSFAARINRLLADGGRWINFGSLSFHQADPAARLTPEECRESIEAQGFAPPDYFETEIPYMSSPNSRHGRRERVLRWRADKQRHIRKLDRHESLPDWLVRGKDPVPLLDDFRQQAFATRIHAFIMSLIDGRRSIADMAAVLEQQQLMPRTEAEPAVRSFLVKMYEDSRRRGVY
jgi:ubiquinone/menaquinone biosynthesis C-methylase UbiE